MARTNKVLNDTTLTGTTEVTVTVPANKQWEIHKFQINNIHASGTANLTLKLDDNTKINAREIANKANIGMPYTYILAAGETIKYTASVANTLNIDVIGVEVDV